MRVRQLNYTTPYLPFSREKEVQGWVERHERPCQPSDEVVRAVARDTESHYRRGLPDGQGKCRVGVVCDREQVFAGPDPYIRYFVNAVVDSGAEPVFLFPGRDTVANQTAGIDALLIPGGADVHPKFYGRKVGPGMDEKATWPEDDAFGLDVIRAASDEKMPMLGICRGHQLMNVAGGGTLIQDIDSEFVSRTGVRINHRPSTPKQEPERTWARTNPAHDMLLDETSQLARILRTDVIAVNSIHHQAVDDLAPDYKIVGIAPDGVVEAIEHRTNPCQIGVQGHPELSRRVDKRFQGVFDYLVAHGSRFRTERIMTAAVHALIGNTAA